MASAWSAATKAIDLARMGRDPSPNGPVVQGFTARGFTVDGGIYEGLLLTPQRADGWEAPPLAELGPEHVEAVLALDPAPEFLLLGTGRSLARPPRAFTAALDARGIGVEVMDSRAAARTWGLLRAEERWIVAALMPLD
jgi:uncharacterized protein